MRSSGNPEAAYSVADMARVGLLKVVDFTGAQSGNLLQLSLLVPVVIWLFSWLVSLFQPSSSWAVVGTLHLVLLWGMLWGFLSRNDSVARVFTGIFWMHAFVRTFSGLSSYSWSYYLAQTILFFFVAYCACAILGTTPLRKHPLFKSARPIIKLVATVLVGLGTVLGILFFFMNIKTRYYDFSSLVLLLGSAMLLFGLAGSFKNEKWMQPIQKYGALLFVCLLLFFGVFDGFLSLIILKGSASSLLLLLRPLLVNLFTASFVLPASFISLHHLHPAEAPRQSVEREMPVTDLPEVMAKVEDEITYPEEMPPVEPALPAFEAEQGLHFVQPEYQEAQPEPVAWQNPLVESVDAPSAWQPLPFDLDSIGSFKSDFETQQAEAFRPLEPLTTQPVGMDMQETPVMPAFSETPVAPLSPEMATPAPEENGVRPSFHLHPNRINEQGQTTMVSEPQETQTQVEAQTQAEAPTFIAPRRVDMQVQPLPVAEHAPTNQPLLDAETKVLPRVTEADLAAARAQQMSSSTSGTQAQENLNQEPRKPQIRRVDTEI